MEHNEYSALVQWLLQQFFRSNGKIWVRRCRCFCDRLRSADCFYAVLPYILSNLGDIVVLISLILNYLLSMWWVFPSNPRKRHIQIILFLIIGLSGLLLNILIIWVASNLLGIYYVTSKIIAIILVFFWSFIGRRYLFQMFERRYKQD